MTGWRTLSEWSLAGAAALCAALGARVLYRGVSSWSASDQVSTSPVQTTETKPAGLPGYLRAADFAHTPNALELANAGNGMAGNGSVGGEPAAPQMVAAFVSVVTDGAARRDVWLNDVHLGQSPYVGQLECEQGKPLEFVLKGKDGKERRVMRPCAKEVRVTD